MESIARSTEEMEAHAAVFIKNITENTKRRTEAVVIGLYGELGSGKTTFVKGIAKAYGLTQTVTSPTFVIEKIYKIDNKRFNYLIHIDAYRLESGDELLTLGWDKILSDLKNIIFIEWPENVKEILPTSMLKIYFTFVDEHTRKIEIKNLEYGI